jgi:hypothetical protein
LEVFNMDHQPKYINEKKVAEIMDVGVQTLRNDRHLRRGLSYVKKGRTVRYSLADVIQYLEDHKIRPEN